MPSEIDREVRYVKGEGWQVRIDNPRDWYT
jgi:hypothetical protein